MDLSNREEAKYWHKRAEEVTDRDLRKEAVATHRKFRKVALREERMRLRSQKPGYGLRTMLGWIVFVALIALAAILGLSKVFSLGMICTALVLAIGLCIVAAAIALRVLGHISEDAMLAMIQTGLKAIHTSKARLPIIEATTEAGVGESSPPRGHLPSDTPAISFDDDD